MPYSRELVAESPLQIETLLSQFGALLLSLIETWKQECKYEFVQLVKEHIIHGVCSRSLNLKATAPTC